MPSKPIKTALATTLATTFVFGALAGTAATSAQAAPLPEAGVEQLAGDLAKSFLQGIVGKSGGFLFDSIFGAGDKSAEELASIASKQDELAAQISQVDQDILNVKSTIDENRVQASINTLSDLSASYNQMYLNTYQPIAEAALAAKNGDGTEDDLQRAKDAFIREYENSQFALDGNAQRIHQSLASGKTDSLTKQYGQALMDKGYLNSTDSQKLRETLAWAQDVQAVAVFMQREYYAAKAAPATVSRVEQQFVTWNKAETDDLPPAIPADQIVVPKDGSTVGGTVLKVTGDDSVQALLEADPMTAIEKQNPGWMLPTGKAVLATARAVQSARGSKTSEKLAHAAAAGDGSAAWAAAVGTTGFVWTSDTTKLEVNCGSTSWTDGIAARSTPKPITYTVHQAAMVDTLIVAGMPAALPDVPINNAETANRASCTKTLNGFFGTQSTFPFATTAGVVLTKTSTVDYMAQS
ncbi:MAG: hypothetical protein HQ526_11385 [Actinobacteria bacterium]|nr:hypothetical protein [Actinomycetota bacterium]